MSRIQAILGFTAEAISRGYYPLNQILPEHDPSLGPLYRELYYDWGMGLASGNAVRASGMTVRSALGQLGLRAEKDVINGDVLLGPLVFDNGQLLTGIGLWTPRPRN